MGLNKNIITKFGVNSEYQNIQKLEIVKNTAYVNLNLFISEEARLSNKAAIQVNEYILDIPLENYSDNPYVICYTELERLA
jgi:hypothetical protein